MILIEKTKKVEFEFLAFRIVFSPRGLYNSTRIGMHEDTQMFLLLVFLLWMVQFKIINR